MNIYFKLATIFFFIIQKKTVFNVKVVVDIYHPTLKFPITLRSILASFSLSFCFHGPQLY